MDGPQPAAGLCARGGQGHPLRAGWRPRAACALGGFSGGQLRRSIHTVDAHPGSSGRKEDLDKGQLTRKHINFCVGLMT